MAHINGSPVIETKWFYEGADGQIYGPNSSQTMMDWVKSGFFSENLLVKTNHEDMFHSLGDWARVLGGKLPFFFSNLTTFDALVGLSPPPMTPMQMQYFYPPGLSTATFPRPSSQMRLPNGMAGFFSPEPPTNTQHPPDSTLDDIYISPEITEPKSRCTCSVGTDPISSKGQESQTDAYVISKEHADRVLSELFGQRVKIF